MLAPEHFPRRRVGRRQIALQLAVRAVNEQHATILTLVHHSRRPADDLSSPMIGLARLKLTGHQGVDDVGVECIVRGEPQIVWDQVRLYGRYSV